MKKSFQANKKQKLVFPHSGREVTLAQYRKLIAMSEEHRGDIVRLFSLFSGETLKYVKSLTWNNNDTMNRALAHVAGLVSYFDKKDFQSLTYSNTVVYEGEVITLPMGFDVNTACYADMHKIATGLPDQWEDMQPTDQIKMFLDVVEQLMQFFLHYQVYGDDYDGEKATGVDISHIPASDVLGWGNFFLSRFLPSKNGLPRKRLRRLVQLMRRWFWRVFLR